MALGAGVPDGALRLGLVELLQQGAPERPRVEPLLHAAADCTLHLPASIGDYTDFYAGIHHATNVGRLFRPDNPLLANYKHVPIGYHGRASSVRPSGEPVRRPNGQRKQAGESEPSFGPACNLDYELELGVWIGAGNPLGEPIPVGLASEHIFGLCLLNDWSARDIQAWEYQPSRPVPGQELLHHPVALDRHRRSARPLPRGAAAPARKATPFPSPTLLDEADQYLGAIDIALEVLLAPHGEAPQHLSASNSTDLYWTLAQFVAHHTSGGCNLNPGDLFGSGNHLGTDLG